MSFPLEFPFFFGSAPTATDANGCWIGLPSPFEMKLLAPCPTYALEQLRQRFLFAVTTTHDLVQSARAVLQMAFETEVGTILVKQVTLASDVMSSVVCVRRHYIDVDQDMRLQRYLVNPAFDDLAKLPGMPQPYVDFLARYVMSDYPRYRMSAIAGALCVTKALQTP